MKQLLEIRNLKDDFIFNLQMGGINLLFEMVGKTTGKIAQKKTTGGEYLMNKTLTSSLNSCPQPKRRTHSERKPLDYKSNASSPTPYPPSHRGSP